MFFIVNSFATVVSPNKGTLKIDEIGSNKGIFPLFIQFPCLKTVDEIPPISPKPRTEIGFSDHTMKYQSPKSEIYELSVVVFNLRSKSFKFY